MILTYGNIAQLKGQKWHLMEIRSEKTAENILRRIGNSLKDIIKDGACEIFIPVGDRDLGVYTLKTSSYIFIRSNLKRELTKFRTITGVLGILCEGEQQRIDKALTVDDEYVQGVIKEFEEAFRLAPTEIRIGSFVRILDGLDRGFCGTVIGVEREYALIIVELKTRRLLIETPLHNLKDLSSVPPEQQVFYYSEVVKEYVSEYGEEANLMLQQDLRYNCDLPLSIEEDAEDNPEEKRIKYGRQKTITAIAKRLMYEGVEDPKVMITSILKEIKDQNIKKPKSIFILYFVLKQIIMETLFKNDPLVKSYKDVIALYGEKWRISPKSIKELDTDDLIPLKSEGNPKSKRNSVIKLEVKDGVVKNRI